MEKRGLSAIVTTLMFILLAFVAVGVIWGIVNNVLEEGAESVDISSKCLEIDFDVINTECDSNGVCNITIERKSGGDDISGVKLLVINETESVSITKEGNIGTSLRETYTNESTNITNLVEIKVNPYFEDEFGKAQDCPLK